MTKTIDFLNSLISYTVVGEGMPVMLVHGFGEDRTTWKNVEEELKGSYKLIIPDLPGSGLSGMIDRKKMIPGIGMTMYADVLKKILDQEKLPSCVMIGHSMGGYITLAFAQKYPEQLFTFGLFHSSAFADSDDKIKMRRKGIEFIRENGAYEFLKTSIPGLFGNRFRNEHPGRIHDCINRGVQFKDEVLIQYYEAMIHRPDLTTVLTSSSKPILFIIGETDLAIPLEQSLKECHLPTISEIEILHGVAHMGMWEDPVRCNQAIKSFLKRIENLF